MPLALPGRSGSRYGRRADGRGGDRDLLRGGGGRLSMLVWRLAAPRMLKPVSESPRLSSRDGAES